MIFTAIQPMGAASMAGGRKLIPSHQNSVTEHPLSGAAQGEAAPFRLSYEQRSLKHGPRQEP